MQITLVAAIAVGGKAVFTQRLFRRLVEHADLADLARFLRRGDLAAEFARHPHQLLDLRHLLRRGAHRLGKRCREAARRVGQALRGWGLFKLFKVAQMG